MVAANKSYELQVKVVWSGRCARVANCRVLTGELERKRAQGLLYLMIKWVSFTKE
jgi:hypothetical protein